MHWIARHILKELAVADSRSYTELLPDGVEGNLFQYHARALEKAGYLARSTAGYELTPTGRQLVGTMSLTRHMARHDQPSPVVMVYAENAEGQIVLFHWRRQPYRGLTSLPFGRQLHGRSPSEAAAEQLWYKSGLTGKLTALGQIDLQTTDIHLLITVFEATNLVGSLGSDGLTGMAEWGNWADVSSTTRLAGQEEILAWIKDPRRATMIEVDLALDNDN